MRIMAIDYGDARTGLAVSDPLGILAGEAWTIKEADPDRLVQAILEAAKTRGVGQLVLGYPLNMDGSAGLRAEKSLALKTRLEAAGAPPVALWDERRTTVDAHRILSKSGYRGKKRKSTVDAVAATLILEGYLASQH